MIKTLIRIRRISFLTSQLLAVDLLNGAATTDSTSVNAVLARPAAYDRQLVTVVGVATGDGPEIEVFDSVAQAKTLDSKRALFVRGDPRKTAQARYDMRKVRVTGQLHCEDHGTWGNPCALHSATIERLSDRLAAARNPSGVFRNDSEETITISIKGQISTQFDLRPGTAETQPLSHIFTMEIRTQNKTLLARKTLVQAAKGQYYDEVAAVLYYRFVNGKIERVLPAAGRKWRVKSI